MTQNTNRIVLCVSLLLFYQLHSSESKEKEINGIEIQRHARILERRGQSRFVPSRNRKIERRYKSRNNDVSIKGSDNEEKEKEKNRNIKDLLSNKYSRRKFVPKRNKKFEKISINTTPVVATRVESNYNFENKIESNYNVENDFFDIKPTPSLKKPETEALNIENFPIIISSIDTDMSGLITVTHALFTITRDQYEETLTSLSEIVDVDKLQSTTLHQAGIMYAHSEYNHPIPGITELTIEQIVPSRTFVAQSKTFGTVYSVVTHTTTMTDNYVAPVPASPSIDNDHGFLPRFPLLPGLLSRLRYPNNNIIPAPVAPTTSYTTSTITKVSTITSGITEEIVITFLNRPITTNYVRTTTMIVTDIHVTRSPVIFGG